MNGKEIIKKGAKTSKVYWIIYIICIVAMIGAMFSMNYRIEKEKPNATDFTENKAYGTEADKYVYLRVDGLTSEIANATSNDDKDGITDRYYIAVNQEDDNYYMYLVDLDSTTLEKLDKLQKWTSGEIDEQPESVIIYGMTEEVSDELKEIAVEVYNYGLEESQKITVDEYENYFGSVVLNTRRDPVNITAETTIALLSVITIIVVIIVHIINKNARRTILKYLKKNNYLEEVEKQLDYNVEKNYYNDKVIVTKDFLVDVTGSSFAVVKFSDIKWIHSHKVKYYGLVTISSSILIHLKDGKTQIGCLEIKGNITPEFEEVYNKIVSKMPKGALNGYTEENIKEFNEYKKKLKDNTAK